jgi:hypothetical protein
LSPNLGVYCLFAQRFRAAVCPALRLGTIAKLVTGLQDEELGSPCGAGWAAVSGAAQRRQLVGGAARSRSITGLCRLSPERSRLSLRCGCLVAEFFINLMTRSNFVSLI